MPKGSQQPEDFIVPLNMNGLEGRMLRLPAKQKTHKREILFVYGQHSSLERWWGLLLVLNRFGAVTVPDMPGFGGMTSLYKIGQDASIDNLADYLAAFVKLKYRHKKVTIMAMSLGFVVATRMLQRYPELTKNVDLVASLVGFGHRDDFVFSKKRRTFYRIISGLFARKWQAKFYQAVFLQPFYLRRVYKHSRFAKEKLSKLSPEEFKKTMDMEIVLWRINDLRTQMKTNNEMFKLDNTKIRVDLPVWHVASKKDRYFDHLRVETHLRQIFREVDVAYTKDPNHAPTIIADEKDAAPFIPDELARKLKSRK